MFFLDMYMYLEKICIYNNGNHTANYIIKLNENGTT